MKACKKHACMVFEKPKDSVCLADVESMSK